MNATPDERPCNPALGQHEWLDPCGECVRGGPWLCARYELHPDGSRRPYKSILEMRAAKLLNHAKVSSWAIPLGKTIGVWYEDMMQYGTVALLRAVSNATGRNITCNL